MNRSLKVVAGTGIALSTIFVCGVIADAKQESVKFRYGLPEPKLIEALAHPAVPCIMVEKLPKPITWEIRAKDGSVLVVGVQEIRKAC